MANFLHEEFYKDMLSKSIDLRSTTATFTAPCDGVMYFSKEDGFKFVTLKQDAIDEIKEQPFF